MRAVSKKRAALNRERRRVILERFGDYPPACAACAPLWSVGVSSEQTGCAGWATEVHEPLTRARGGSITDPDNMVPISAACHAYVHAHPELGHRAGLLRSAGPRSLP